MADVAELLVRIDATTEQLRREMARADKSVGDFSTKTDRSLKKIETSFSRFDAASRTVTKSLAAFGVALSVNAITNFVTSNIRAADSLAKTADKLGVTIEGLQELRYGAARSGVEIRQLDTGLQRFTRRLAEAQQGQGELLGTLKQYGIELRNANGTARSAEEVLADYANAIQGAESQQEKLRLAFKAFDSEGAGLVNLLRNGAEGLAEFRRQARAAGVVLNADLARQAEVLNDRLGVLEERSKVASTTLVLSLTPAIETVLEVYERFSIGTSNLIAQFQELNTLGLGQLEQKADSLRNKIQILETTNPGDLFGTLSGARKELAEVEAQIERIKNAAVPTGGTVTENLLGEPTKIQAANDNLAALNAQLERARTALDALKDRGSDAYARAVKQAEVEERAAKAAEAFNKANQKAIDGGQIRARTAGDYLTVLTEIADVEEETTDTKALDDYIRGLTDAYGVAKTRLEVGEAEAKIQAELNKLRAQGVEITADEEKVIRRTIEATERLNDQWNAQQQAIKDAAKAMEDAQAQVTDTSEIPEDCADAFTALIMEALAA